MRYFISDCHFDHWNYQTQQGIITFERTNFSSIDEHNMAIVNMIYKLCKIGCKLFDFTKYARKG